MNAIQKKSEITIAQVSDTHLLDNSNQTFLDVNPYKRLKTVLDYINNKEYDFVIFSGDIANEGKKESYQQFSDLLKLLKHKIIIFPGNHDDPHWLNSMLSDNTDYILSPNNPVIFQDWAFLYLNTLVEGEGYGYISPDNAAQLEAQISNANAPHLCLMMHHNPFETGISRIDPYSIRNFNVLQHRLSNTVKLVLYGHVHHDLLHVNDSIVYTACPSTVFQFNSDGEFNNRYYGFKEHRLKHHTICSRPIWFFEE